MYKFENYLLTGHLLYNEGLSGNNVTYEGRGIKMWYSPKSNLITLPLLKINYQSPRCQKAFVGQI